jgi:hypothetical protein
LASTTFYAIIATYCLQVLCGLEHLKVTVGDIATTLTPTSGRLMSPPRQTPVGLSEPPEFFVPLNG